MLCDSPFIIRSSCDNCLRYISVLWYLQSCIMIFLRSFLWSEIKQVFRRWDRTLLKWENCHSIILSQHHLINHLQVLILLAFNLSDSRSHLHCYFTLLFCHHVLITVNKMIVYHFHHNLQCLVISLLIGRDLTISGLIYVWWFMFFYCHSASLFHYPFGKTALKLKIASQMDYRLVSVSDCPTWAVMRQDCDTVPTKNHSSGAFWKPSWRCNKSTIWKQHTDDVSDVSKLVSNAA